MNNTDVHTSIPKAEASTMRGTTDERDNRDNRDNRPTSSLAFFSPSEKASRISALTSSGTLVVRLELLQPSARGRLGEVIDEGIERELHARGAAGPGVGPHCERSATLGDQLFRARRVGATRIAVLLGPLRAILGPEGALEVEDSATLRFLAASTRLSPVLLWLDDGDGLTGAFVDPVPLAQLFNLAVPTPRRTNEARNGGNGMASNGPSSERRPRLGTATWSASEPAAKSNDAGTVQRAAMAQLFSDTEEDAETDPFKAELAAPDAPLPAPPSPPSRPSSTAAAPSEPVTPKVQAAILAESKAPPPDAWRTWTNQLSAVRGPQPLATLGKLFAESYLPLANALATGLKDAKAVAAHDEFRRNFERAYVEACPTFAVTGKRPKLVLDLPDIAARNARLHGARSVHLLMVDSMRFDLGSLVKTALQRALEGRATLTEETLLWSALPSTTTRQLEGLARGLDSLRTPPTLEREGDALRGRTAEIVRRIRAGSRDLFKLDIVEARLRETPNKAISSLPDIALATATVLARHCDHLPPRTLLVVFGDHGFTTDEHGNAVHGGASPEEVLVPAYMFLMGEVH